MNKQFSLIVIGDLDLMALAVKMWDTLLNEYKAWNTKDKDIELIQISFAYLPHVLLDTHKASVKLFSDASFVSGVTWWHPLQTGWQLDFALVQSLQSCNNNND